MSYSFSVGGATKAEVLAKVSEELDKVVAAQPMHSNDRQQAYAAAEAFVEIVPEDADKEYVVSIHGSVGWSDTTKVIMSAGVGISVHLTNKPETV